MYSKTYTVMDDDEWNEIVRQHFNIPHYDIHNLEDVFGYSLMGFCVKDELDGCDEEALREMFEDELYWYTNVLATKLAVDGVIPKGQNLLIEFFW